MKKRSTNYGGLLLIMLGGLALLQATIFPLLGWDFSLWRFWPLGVGALGLAFIAAPFIFIEQDGLKALFIPGFPILVVSSLLLWGSLFNAWGCLGIPLANGDFGTGRGFPGTSVFHAQRLVHDSGHYPGHQWLNLPILRHYWFMGSWAILWTLEPLAVGLALLVASGGKRPGLMWAG